MTALNDQKAMQRFLTFVNSITTFIPNLSEYGNPLRVVCKKNVQFNWSSEHETAFVKIEKT